MIGESSSLYYKFLTICQSDFTNSLYKTNLSLINLSLKKVCLKRLKNVIVHLFTPGFIQLVNELITLLVAGLRLSQLHPQQWSKTPPHPQVNRV